MFHQGELTGKVLAASITGEPVEHGQFQVFCKIKTNKLQIFALLIHLESSQGQNMFQLHGSKDSV